MFYRNKSRHWKLSKCFLSTLIAGPDTVPHQASSVGSFYIEIPPHVQSQHLTNLMILVTCHIHNCGGNCCCSESGAGWSSLGETLPVPGSDSLCTLSSKNSSCISCAVQRERWRHVRIESKTCSHEPPWRRFSFVILHSSSDAQLRERCNCGISHCTDNDVVLSTIIINHCGCYYSR